MKNPSRIPNLRNLGITLRILLIVNAALAMAAFILSSGLNGFVQRITDISALAQPMLLISLFLLYGCHPLLAKLGYYQGIVAIFGIVLLSTAGVHAGFSLFWIFNEQLPPLTRVLSYALILTFTTLYYFYLYQRAYSPAIAEARLQALQARIRPHFLFNSLNAVLSLIRKQPKQAETALEDMADLFRVLMADNRDLVPLAQEIALCKQYLALEKLRLDERLNVVWKIDDISQDALVPPLLLQPLLENAVYHGIEPLAKGGEITVQIYTRQDTVHIALTNPCSAHGNHHNGNKMALANIKERLALHFDLEASLKSKLTNNEYEVHIMLPYHRQSAS